MSLQETEAEAAAAAKEPTRRVSLASMEAKITSRWDRTLDVMLGGNPAEASRLAHVSVCVLLMENGFTVIGQAAPVEPYNFNPELGRKFAYEDAIRKVWPLEGYALRERLAAED